MKKNIIVTLLVSLFSLSISAQYTKGDFFIQPKLGFNMSKFVGSGLLYSPKWKAGYEAGVEAEWFVSTHNSLSFGLAYRQIGCGFNYKEIHDMWYKKSTDKLERLNMNYIALPVMYNFYVKPHLAFKIGVEVSGLLTAKLHAHSYGKIADPLPGNDGYSSDDDVTKYVWHDFSHHETTEKNNDFKRVCVAIPVGISYDYKQFVMTGIVHIDLNRIYTYDKIYIPGGGMSDKHGLRNLYIGITAGYKFKL